MITCEIWGPTEHVNHGLGNQMFCIAATKALAWRNQDGAVFEQSSHQVPYRDNVFRKLTWGQINIKSIYKEGELDVGLYRNIPYKKNMCLQGFFQSEKYFLDFKKEIKDLFGINSVNLDYIKKEYGDIINNSISIHIRRQDYMETQQFHPLCTIEYYKEAIDSFDNGKYRFLVFSDDIEWCKNNFIGEKFIFLNDKDYIDLWLMSLCEHNIIANSTFSWWGAWLNKNPHKKVISPKKWFGPAYTDINNSIDRDLIPEKWIKI